MNVLLHLSPEVAIPFDESFFLRVAEETLKECPPTLLLGKEEITLNVVAVSKERIQELNNTYRGKDAATDILSFSEYADTEAFRADVQKQIFLGEIFFCQDVIMEGATEDALTGAHEMIYVFSHGVLHLLGYDHCDEMFAIQDTVTASLVKQSLGEESAGSVFSDVLK
ncbi:MAG: rRNA maturation RNase YbeY [Candidatus Moranbacteria bacterium]|nr:rRNA maturation RNase YbeY [Candidatus Moranbacteria bacterium]